MTEQERHPMEAFVWQELDSLADTAETVSKREGPGIHPHLIQRMIDLVRRRDLDGLKKLVEEEDIFAYTANVRDLLEMLK